MNGFVAAFIGADRPRTADVVRAGRERVVLAFAFLPPDRVDRRQVENVEAELARRNRSRASTSRNVPWRPGSGLVERGKSSYQLEKRARTGSTATVSSLS